MKEFPIEIEVHYPKQAVTGVKYTMTADIFFNPEEYNWPFEREEIPIYCLINSSIFAIKYPENPVFLLHRYGGTYGKLTFFLEACNKEESGDLTIILLSDGIPIGHIDLESMILDKDTDKIKKVKTETDMQATMDKYPEIMTRINGALKMLQGHGDSGTLTQDLLNNFGNNAINRFDEIVTKTGNVMQAYQLMAYTLNRILWYAHQNNLTIDESTQKFIDNTRANGIYIEKTTSQHDTMASKGTSFKIMPDIYDKNTGELSQYKTTQEKFTQPLLEAKIIIVGSGDVGKTSLMKKLKDNDFIVEPGKEDTTRGIDIQPWQLSCPFPDGQTRDVNIHFWDFGGQDILHATHQFFLTKRSLYLFVWDPRKEEETRSFDYWLNAVKLFGAESPLIMVMNKADIRTKPIDEASFRDKFPNIVQFHQISCVNGQQIPELIETIRRSLCKMPHLLDRLPKHWKDIRNELKARKDNYISREDYFAVCRTHGMDAEKALFLSEYLHDLGIILHFHQDPVLADTVILKPEWATGAVYSLIDSLEIQKNRGRFNRANLDRYWDKKKYPQDKYPQLLRLIEKFELCFNIVGTDAYILPELLPSQRPPLQMEAYGTSGALHLHYSYDFMPAGIITRFISRLHYLIRDDHYWNNGVELAFSGSSALVVSDSVQKRIRISVAGNNNTQLMGVIRGHFDHIHETLNMKKEEHVFEEVPCICPKCRASGKPHYYEYNFLQKLMAKNKDATCVKSAEEVSVHQLLNGLLPPKQPENLFDSVVTTVSQLTEIRKTLQPDENSRNTIVSLLLQTRGFRVLDQTLSGLSVSGERLGEQDIKIEDKETGRSLSIIEALNLDKYDTTKIDSHIMKLLHRYDSSGLKENYILVYASANDFAGLCRKYRDHLPQIDYGAYPLKEKAKIAEVPTGFNKIKAFRARHLCNDGETILYHLLVEM